MKNYSSKEIIAILKKDGWYKVNTSGTSHQQFKHPCKDIPLPTLKSIESQSGLSFQ